MECEIYEMQDSKTLANSDSAKSLYHLKAREFCKDGNIYRFYHFFWFTYTYARDQLSEDWIKQFAPFICNPGLNTEYQIFKDKMLCVIDHRIKLNDADYKRFLEETGLEIGYFLLGKRD